MATALARPRLRRHSIAEGVALCWLLVLFAFVVAGPGGLLAWQENRHALTERQRELAQLTQQRDRLQNRVALLATSHVDPDLAGELLRSRLNVVRPDEMVMLRH